MSNNGNNVRDGMQSNYLTTDEDNDFDILSNGGMEGEWLISLTSKQMLALVNLLDASYPGNSETVTQDHYFGRELANTIVDELSYEDGN